MHAKRTPGPSGRRARTKPVRDNTAVAGLITEKDGGLRGASARGRRGSVANPFKSFLEACDCLEAEEALQEVGIVRVADLLELDAELVAILELPEHVQQRLISAIQVAIFAMKLKERGLGHGIGPRSSVVSMPPTPTMPPDPPTPSTTVQEPMTAPEVTLLAPPLEMPEPAPASMTRRVPSTTTAERATVPPASMERASSAAQAPVAAEKPPVDRAGSMDAATIGAALELHKQASQTLQAEIAHLERKLSRAASKKLDGAAAATIVDRPTPASAALPSKPAVAMNTAKPSGGISNKIAAIREAQEADAASAAIYAAAASKARAHIERPSTAPAPKVPTAAIAATFTKEAIPDTTPSQPAQDVAPAPPARLQVQRSLEKMGLAPELAKRLSGGLVERSAPLFPTRVGVKAMREAIASAEAGRPAPQAGVAATARATQPERDAVAEKLKAFQTTAPANPDPSEPVRRAPGKNAAMVARFEAKKAELAARGRTLGKNAAMVARFEAKPSGAAESSRPTAPGKAAATAARFEGIQAAAAEGGAKPLGKAAATAARFENKQAAPVHGGRRSVTGPGGAAALFEKKQAAHAGGKDSARAAPQSGAASVAARFEEKAKQAQAAAVSSRAPSQLSQREQAMRAFGKKLDKA